MGRRRAAMVVPAILALLLGHAIAAEAQVLVVAERNLSFGLVTPGVPMSVSPLDVANSAQLRMEGQGRFQLSFELPASLTSAANHEIPLVFGQGDGILVVDGRGRRTFNPNQTVQLNLTQNRDEVQINLGGRALPAPGQPAGRYAATIVLIIVQSGT